MGVNAWTFSVCFLIICNSGKKMQSKRKKNIYICLEERERDFFLQSDLQLRGSLHGIKVDYHDVHNWSLYEKPGLPKADTATVHPENSGFHYYATLPIFITDTHA